MADLVSNMRFTPYVRPYVEGATKEYAAMQQDARNQYDTNAAGYDAIKEAADKMVSLKPDEEAKQAVMGKVRSTLEQAANEGDYENKGRAVRKAYMDFEKEYAPIAKEYSAYQSFVKDVDEDKTLTQAQKDVSKAHALDMYTQQRKNGIPLKNPDGTVNGISPFLTKHASNVDTTKKTLEAVKSIIPNIVSLNDIKPDEKGGYYMIVNGTKEYIDKGRVDKAINDAYASDSEWQDFDKSRAYFKNYKLTDEEIKNKYDVQKAQFAERLITPTLISQVIHNTPDIKNSKNPEAAAIVALNHDNYYTADEIKQHAAILEEKKLHPKDNYTNDYIQGLKENYKGLAESNEVNTQEKLNIGIQFPPKDLRLGAGAGTDIVPPEHAITVEAGTQTITPSNIQVKNELYNNIAKNTSDNLLAVKSIEETSKKELGVDSKTDFTLVSKDFNILTPEELKVKYKLDDKGFVRMQDNINQYNTAQDNYAQSKSRKELIEQSNAKIFSEPNLKKLEADSGILGTSLFSLLEKSDANLRKLTLTDKEIIQLYKDESSLNEIAANHKLTPVEKNEALLWAKNGRDSYLKGTDTLMAKDVTGISSLGYFLNTDKKTTLGDFMNPITMGVEKALGEQTVAGTTKSLAVLIAADGGDVNTAKVVGQVSPYTNTIGGKNAARVIVNIGTDTKPILKNYDININYNDEELEKDLSYTYWSQDNTDVKTTIAKGFAERKVINLSDINQLDNINKGSIDISYKTTTPEIGADKKPTGKKVSAKANLVVEELKDAVLDVEGNVLKKGLYVLKNKDGSFIKNTDGSSLYFNDYDAIKQHVGKMILDSTKDEYDERVKVKAKHLKAAQPDVEQPQ